MQLLEFELQTVRNCKWNRVWNAGHESAKQLRLTKKFLTNSNEQLDLDFRLFTGAKKPVSENNVLELETSKLEVSLDVPVTARLLRQEFNSETFVVRPSIVKGFQWKS